MEFKFIKLIVVGLVFLANTCSKEDVPAELSKCNLNHLVKSVSDVSGTIWFDSQSQTYAIYRGIDGTYDAQEIGVVCNLPKNYKKEGKKIVFSGKYYENQNFSSQIPGQEYYYLELTKIDIREEN